MILFGQMRQSYILHFYSQSISDNLVTRLHYIELQTGQEMGGHLPGLPSVTTKEGENGFRGIPESFCHNGSYDNK